MFAENNALTQTDSAEYQLLMRTLKRFVNAKTLGSLIQVPQEEEAELKVFPTRCIARTGRRFPAEDGGKSVYSVYSAGVDFSAAI